MGALAARTAPLPTVRILMPALAGGLLVAVLALYFQRGVIPGDAFTYLAAGERLNAGHPLYALAAGDRPVDLHPPYWTVPLLSPPLIAVVLRPFALLGDAGAYAWWAACLVVIGTVLAALTRRAPAATSLVVIALVFPLAYEIGVGNVNGLLLGGAIGAWLLARAGRFGVAGPLAAVMAAIKVTPLPLAAWVAGAGRGPGLRGALAGVAAAAAVSLVGAGLAAHVDYLSVMRTTTTAGLSPWSVGGLARTVGLPDPFPGLLPTALLGAGTLAALVLPLRGRVTAGYAVAIVAWTFGSPVVNINTPVLLVALLAPVAWPWDEVAGPALSDREDRRTTTTVDEVRAAS